jgi:hypothetical protein
MDIVHVSPERYVRAVPIGHARRQGERKRLEQGLQDVIDEVLCTRVRLNCAGTRERESLRAGAYSVMESPIVMIALCEDREHWRRHAIGGRCGWRSIVNPVGKNPRKLCREQPECVNDFHFGPSKPAQKRQSKKPGQKALKRLDGIDGSAHLNTENVLTGSSTDRLPQAPNRK